MIVVPLTAAGPSSLPSCTTASLAPNLASLSVVQGLPQGSSGQTYAMLARGKDTLVRAYLTLPTTCAVSKSQSITPKTATLAVSNSDGAQPAVASYNALSGNLTSTTQVEGTSDPLFVVPASDLTPSAITSFSLGLTLTVNYAVNGGTTTTAITYAQKNVQVDQKSHALRVLVVPMGDPSAGTTQWTDTDQAALQKLMTTASRVLPVETGTGDLSSAATGGIRYVVNQGLLDVKSLGLYATGSSSSSRFCANGANWSTTQVLSGLTLKGQLAQTLADWNAANPTRLADAVLGVIDENNSFASNNTAGLACDDGRAATPIAGSSGQVAWVRVTASGTNSPGVMELVHTIGIVDQTIASSFHSANVEADLPNGSSPDPNNGYNALQRKVLYAGGLFGNDHSAMNYNSTSIPYTNDNLTLEPRDWADIACDLGGTCGAASGGSATLGSSVGTSNGVAAGSSGYDINGTVNGDGTVTVANAHIVGNFLQTGLAPASAALHLFERTGSCASPGSTLMDVGVAQFPDEGHSDPSGGQDAGVGALFHAITQFDTSATVVQLTLNGNVVFCKSIGTAGETPSVQSTSSVAPGSLLASFPMPACCNGRGIAFDGTHLWVTNNGGSTLMWELTMTGQVVHTFDTGVVLGSLAFNPSNNHLIGGNYNPSTSADDNKVWDIQPLPDGTPDAAGNLPVNRSLLFQFTTDATRTTCRGGNPGAIDGLERLADGSFALSGDVETTVHLLTSGGTETSSFSAGGCNSGITTDGADGLWLALLNASCCGNPMMLQHVNSSGAPTGDPLTITGYEAEDIAFDAKTFAPSCVVWLNQGTSDTAQIRAVAVPCPAAKTNATGATFTATGTTDVGSAYFTCDAVNGPFYPIASGLRPTDVENGISRFVFYYNTAGISCGNGTPKILTAASNFFNQSPLTDASAQLPVNSTDKPPTAAIDAPVQNETYLQGASIAFNGTGNDPEDGNLTGASLAWSVDGTAAGTGNSFDKTTTDLNLSPGTHTVSLVATDTTQQTGTAQVTIVVTADTTPPALALSQSPIGNPWVTTSPVNVTVTGSDNAANDTGLASVGCSVDFLGVGLPAIQNPAATYSASFPVTGDGIHQVSCLASDKVGNQTAANDAVYIDATPCNGGPGHTVLQPVNNDGSSVFKKGSTIAVKFRVCVNGTPVSTPVGSPRIPAPLAPNGTPCSSTVPFSTGTPVFCSSAGGSGGVNETVISTAADTAFRWDPTAGQMIFNMATANLAAGQTYTYYIPLADGSNSNIFFTFGLR